MVNVLERLAHEVDYPERKTCYGQLAFNSDYFSDAKQVAQRILNACSFSEPMAP